MPPDTRLNLCATWAPDRCEVVGEQVERSGSTRTNEGGDASPGAALYPCLRARLPAARGGADPGQHHRPLVSAVILARTAVMSIRLRLKAEALMSIPLRIEEQRIGPCPKNDTLKSGKSAFGAGLWLARTEPLRRLTPGDVLDWSFPCVQFSSSRPPCFF